MTRTRIEKRFSYRDCSGMPLEAHVEHWRGFTWQAGPVCVQHKGAPWGTPQVWAASAGEGKRVIRHAAAAAGINPDADGCEWIISGSLNPRYGRSGQMGVKVLPGGFPCVTKRDGPSGTPEVARPDP